MKAFSRLPLVATFETRQAYKITYLDDIAFNPGCLFMPAIRAARS
jgi:hypothetical protein